MLKKLIGILRALRYDFNRRQHMSKVRMAYRRLNIISPGKLVFEIGSFDGMVGLALHNMGARIVMAEPQPMMCEKIRERFAGKDNWTLEEAGVGAKAGTMTLKISSNLMASTFSSKFADLSSKETGKPTSRRSRRKLSPWAT